MNRLAIKSLLTIAAIVVGLLASDPAHAFRCKNKIVTDGMHEQRVLALCGKPTAMRHLGYAVRSFDLGRRVSHSGIRGRRFSGFGHVSQEVVVTEYVYNFGPRKLMRRLVFEGSVLVSIETIGYGYIEKKS